MVVRGLSAKLGHKPKRIIGGASHRQLFFWVYVLVLKVLLRNTFKKFLAVMRSTAINYVFSGVVVE